MSREKRYTFSMELTEQQTKMMQDTWDECVGIESGEGLIATVGLRSGRLNCTIIPASEKVILAAAINAMEQRTELDDLGRIDA